VFSVKPADMAVACVCVCRKSWPKVFISSTLSSSRLRTRRTMRRSKNGTRWTRLLHWICVPGQTLEGG